MEMAMTTISRNGQIVIPAGMRRNAKINVATKFMMVQDGDMILLKKVTPEMMDASLSLTESLRKIDAQINKGKYAELDASMNIKEMDKTLRRKSR